MIRNSTELNAHIVSEISDGNAVAQEFNILLMYWIMKRSFTAS